MLIGEFIVNGHNIKTSFNMRFPGDDLSGQTNSTNLAENGIKPKTVGVSLSVPFHSPQWLTSLREVAEKEEDNGKRKIYSFTNRAAVPMNINQVRFTDNFFVREDEELKQWLISFQLTEYRSTPEKSGERKTNTPVTTQASTGKTVGSANKTQDAVITADKQATSDDEAPAELSSFEKVLKSIDDYLKPDETSTESSNTDAP